MGMFDDVFGGGMGGASDDLSQGYQQSIADYQKYLDQTKQLFQPWMDQGMRAGNQMETMGGDYYNQFAQMMGLGPGGTGNWMTQYSASPWAQYQTDIGNQSAMASASASGMLGSGVNQREMDQMSQNIASQDRQQYYNDMMGLGQGATSNYQPLYSTGAGMTGQLGGYNMATGGLVGAADQGIGQANAMGDLANSNMIGNMINTGVSAFSLAQPYFSKPQSSGDGGHQITSYW
jgi:hypothetical protein